MFEIQPILILKILHTGTTYVGKDFSLFDFFGITTIVVYWIYLEFEIYTIDQFSIYQYDRFWLVLFLVMFHALYVGWMVHDYTTSPSLQESWEPIEPMENNNISLQVSQITFLQVPGLGDWNHHWNGRLTKRGCWCKNNPRTNVFRPAMSWVNHITNNLSFWPRFC